LTDFYLADNSTDLPKGRCISTRVHGIASRQTIMLFTVTTRRTSNLALDSLFANVILLSSFNSASNGKIKIKGNV
jgi:hypothetical protein